MHNTQQIRFWNFNLPYFYKISDIQMICGGKNRRFQYSEKDYVQASLSLYIDVAFLLMMVLGLTGAAR